MNIDDRELKSIIRRIAEKVIREALETETVERGALARTRRARARARWRSAKPFAVFPSKRHRRGRG